MANTVETIWKIVLDEKEIRDGESTIQRMARLLKDKLGADATKAIDKTTEAIKDQTDALKENEKAAQRAGDASGGVGALAGGVGGGLGSVGRLAGVGGLVGAGEGLGMVGDIGDAVEGLQELGGTLAELGPAGALAGVAIVALGLVISDFAQAAQKQADEINTAIDSMREVADEIAGGATTEDVQESIAQLQFRRDMERDILAESTASYEAFIQGIRDAFGPLAGLVEGVLKVIDPREEALNQQIETSNKLIAESEAKERAYNEALDKGLTSKADAKQAAEEQAKAQEKAAREAEQAAKKAEQEREREAAAAERAAQQLAQKQEQIEQKRYQAAQKYGDALVDIARKSSDDAAKLAQDYRYKQIDTQRGFEQDILDLTLDFQDKEYEETLKRQEEEARDLKSHSDTLMQIRDDAASEEQDLLRQRDFLGATRVREAANKRMEDENTTFLKAQEEKLAIQRSEDAQQLRELDNARQKRLTALQRANEDALTQYKRDVDNQRQQRRIAEREAAIARNRELRAAQEMAQALLGIHQQQNQSILGMASATASQLRGITNNSTNNSRTVNGGIHMNFPAGAGSFSAGAVRSQVLGALQDLGYDR